MIIFTIKIEWTEHEIDAFTKALHKFGNNWSQIAEYVHRSEQSCRAFYQKNRKKNGLIDDEHVNIFFRKKSQINYFFSNRISMKIMQVYQVQKIYLVE